MINKRKVRLMTRTAMYERHECSADLPKAKYYKNDYVGLHMWLTAIAVTAAYIIIIMLVAACNFEYIINHLTDMKYSVVGILILMGYLVMETIFLLAAYFIYSYKYVVAEHGIKVYQNRLQKILAMNKADQKRKGGKTQ
ncbi:MAG: hypothetical protein PUA49_09175 [Butyrivibrio sp.]|nr:hypothetical protein [Butyrivibrio sp.]